jgi:hypothetical protein
MDRPRSRAAEHRRRLLCRASGGGAVRREAPAVILIVRFRQQTTETHLRSYHGEFSAAESERGRRRRVWPGWLLID